MRDAVRPAEYEAACLDLIAKFKTLRTALRDDGVPDVEHFMATYSMDCASAAARLLRSGLPATIEHGKPRHVGGPPAALFLSLPLCALTRPRALDAEQAPATRPRLWLRRRSTSSPALTC